MADQPRTTGRPLPRYFLPLVAAAAVAAMTITAVACDDDEDARHDNRTETDSGDPTDETVPVTELPNGDDPYAHDPPVVDEPLDPGNLPAPVPAPSEERDSDYDGIPDSEDIDSNAPTNDDDMDGIPDYDDISPDNPILDNYETNLDATNVWTEDY